MRLRFLTLFGILAAALSAPLVSHAGVETPANSYEFVQVGAWMLGSDVNDAGHVVGVAYGVDQDHAFLWVNGVLTDLGTLGGNQSSAEAVNNLDRVVGWSYTSSNDMRAFLWSPNTGMQDLGALGGTWSTARAINDAGQVAGSSADATGDERATLWQSGQAYDLGVPPGYATSTAYNISASGEVVGYLRDFANETRAFRWTPTVANGTTGTMVVLQPDLGSAAYGINSAGDTVGEAQSADQFFFWSTLWDAAGAHSIPPLPGSFGSTAVGINASRTVVGYDLLDDGAGGTVTRAYAWSPAYGTRPLDLLARSGFLPLDSAAAVNASGQIVANSNGAVYLLSPSGVPPYPNNLGVLSEATTVTLTWSPSSGAEQYLIRRAIGSSSYTTLGSVAGTSFTDTAVTSGVTYSYVVSAANTYGQSGPSSPVTVTIKPPPPTNLTATAAKGKRKVELKWKQSTGPGVTQNRIYRSTISGGYMLRATVSATTTFTDTSVNSGVTYYYVVTAVTSTGRSSAVSNQASATPR